MNKKLFVLIICISFIVMTLCAFVQYKNITPPYVYVDEETGVNYLVYSVGYKGGITPRFNSDSSLYVTAPKME